MARSLMIGLCVTLSLVGSVKAQSSQYPRVTIILPQGIPSAKVVVQYVLYGSFGASANFIPAKPNSKVLEIRTSVGNNAASEIKMFVWAPGCKIATFEMPLDAYSDIKEPFLCAFLPVIKLEGEMELTGPLTKKHGEVLVTYWANWACGFFGFADCMVPQFQLGTAEPDENGAFTIEIPDLGSDPITSSSIRGAELTLILRDAKTLNHIAMLEPRSETLRDSGGGLKIQSSYPRPLEFVPRKSN